MLLACLRSLSKFMVEVKFKSGAFLFAMESLGLYATEVLRYVPEQITYPLFGLWRRNAACGFHMGTCAQCCTAVPERPVLSTSRSLLQSAGSLIPLQQRSSLFWSHCQIALGSRGSTGSCGQGHIQNQQKTFQSAFCFVWGFLCACNSGVRTTVNLVNLFIRTSSLRHFGFAPCKIVILPPL